MEHLRMILKNSLYYKKKAIRILNSLNYNDHTACYFKNMQLLKLSDIYKYNILVFTYKILILNENNHVITFQQQLTNHNYNTRNRAAICTPLFKRSKSQFSILYSAGNAWNNLPTETRDCNSLAGFKTALKQNILASY